MSYSKDDIPDFLSGVGAELTDMEQRIDTDILEPVVFSDNFIRFQLQRKGLLNPQSRITFSFTNPAIASSFLPLGTGIGSLIQRATLKIGGKKYFYVIVFPFLKKFIPNFIILPCLLFRHIHLSLFTFFLFILYLFSIPY